jgi:hypothetical protein
MGESVFIYCSRSARSLTCNFRKRVTKPNQTSGPLNIKGANLVKSRGRWLPSFESLSDGLQQEAAAEAEIP